MHAEETHLVAECKIWSVSPDRCREISRVCGDCRFAVRDTLVAALERPEHKSVADEGHAELDPNEYHI